MYEVEIVNEKDEVIGRATKKEAHEKNLPHRVAVVYVENGKKEILVQHRKDGYLDHSAAGHIDVGESYLDAAKRELEEELGITSVPLTPIGFCRTRGEKYPDATVSHVMQVFKCVAEPGELQEDEVHEVHWAEPEKIAEDMEKNPGDYCGGFIESLKLYLANR